jgi:hypothetical protein
VFQRLIPTDEPRWFRRALGTYRANSNVGKRTSTRATTKVSGLRPDSSLIGRGLFQTTVEFAILFTVSIGSLAEELQTRDKICASQSLHQLRPTFA